MPENLLMAPAAVAPKAPAARLIALMAFLLVFFAHSAPAPAAVPPPVKSLVAFGDSYSDNGAIDGAGFMRYTDPLTWVEIIGRALNVPVLDLAWGGALSDQRNYAHPKGEDWSGLNWQVDRYLESLPASEDISGVLFTIMAGSNDAWAEVTDASYTAANIKEAIEKLAKRGAKRVLYRETSAVLLSPGYLAGPYAELAGAWSKLVNDANQITRKELSAGLSGYPELKIYYQGTDELMEKVKSGAEGFAYENLTEAWSGTYSLPRAGGYLWYDEWHPTGSFHELMAAEALATIKAAN
jgi:phospholipase/lecithinase/hemolysin